MRSFVVLANGLKLHGMRWDDQGAGAPTLLLHGLASNARIWETTAPMLALGGLAPIALDLRGHGLSDKPDEGYEWSMVTEDVRAAIRTLGLDQPLVVGHSWGAGLALHLAAAGLGGGAWPRGLVVVDGGISQLDDLPGATCWRRRRWQACAVMTSCDV